MSSKRISCPTEKVLALQATYPRKCKVPLDSSESNKQAKKNSSATPSSPVTANQNSSTPDPNSPTSASPPPNLNDDESIIETEPDIKADESAESSEAELVLDRLKREWNSPIYAFFAPEPTIEYIAGCHSHVFWCTAKGCKKGVRGYLDKSDARSTGNMRKHVKACWGEDVLQKAFKMSGTTAA
ncbi:hypothetical protein EDD15DRAFT_2192058 [Pisolithus albus]|nr:hypothetical protein EDD15DRAFT_2192058 [Pisolithus albus]